MKTMTNAGAVSLRCLAAAALLAALAGCQEDIHSAQWWMGHGPELQAKLEECKKYPSLNQSDQNCKNANEAFATLLAATAQKPQTPPSESPDAH